MDDQKFKDSLHQIRYLIIFENPQIFFIKSDIFLFFFYKEKMFKFEKGDGP